VTNETKTFVLTFRQFCPNSVVNPRWCLLSPDDNEGEDLEALHVATEIEDQLDMFETEVHGDGVGDEEVILTVDSDDEDGIAGDVASSDTAAVMGIIHDADASIHLDPLPLDKVNVGRVSIAKVSL